MKKFRKRKHSQIEMVSNLAYKINGNVSWKQLVLSVEEAAVKFLRDECFDNDSSVEDGLELEPMGTYERHLVHCLAEIFKLDHESVGEGDDRHMVLDKTYESSVPEILVRDYLWIIRGRNASADTTMDLICRYDGEMEIESDGTAEYIGGETKERSCSITTSYDDFVKILEEVSEVDPCTMDMSFRYYTSGYACKVDGVSDYASMMKKYRRDPLLPIVIWIFKEDKELENKPVLNFEIKKEMKEEIKEEFKELERKPILNFEIKKEIKEEFNEVAFNM